MADSIGGSIPSSPAKNSPLEIRLNPVNKPDFKGFFVAFHINLRTPIKPRVLQKVV